MNKGLIKTNTDKSGREELANAITHGKRNAPPIYSLLVRLDRNGNHFHPLAKNTIPEF